jgi:hypothetical protein
MKKQSFSSVICFFLIICFTPIFMGNVVASVDEGMAKISSPALEPVELSEIQIEVSSLGTFLRVYPYMEESVSLIQELTIIDLEAEGLSDSKWVSINYSGEIYYEGGWGVGKKQVDGEIPLIGMSGSTLEFKSVDNLNRVPGAINSGADYKTAETYLGNFPTDISEDFIIRSLFGNRIEIPNGTKFLFLSYAGINYPDNAGTIQVTSTKIELYQPLMPIVGAIIATIAIIALIAWWLIIRPPKPSTTETAVNAHLLSLGNGKLELIDNTLSFQLEKGYIRKRTKTVREIPMTDIKSMNRTGNELIITWKKVTDLYLIEEKELAGSIFEMIPQTSIEQRRMFENKEAVKQKRNDLIDILNETMETVDPLFDILISLNGWINWKRVERFLKHSQERKRAIHLKDQNIGITVLDFTKLSSAIKEHQREEITKETYNILRLLYDYIIALASTNEFPEPIHPNYYDAKTTIQAYYLLNGIILGIIVGDRVEKEINALVAILENLSNKSGLRINIDALKDTIDKVDAEPEKESAIEENRTLFRKQLKDFKKIESRSFIKPPYPPLKPSTLLRVKKIFRFIYASVWVRVRLFFGRIRKRTREME